MYSVQFLVSFYRPDQTAPLIPRHPAVQFRSLTREATDLTHPEHNPPGVLFCGNDTANFGCTEIVAACSSTGTLARRVNRWRWRHYGDFDPLQAFGMEPKIPFLQRRNGRSGAEFPLPATLGAMPGPGRASWPWAPKRAPCAAADGLIS
jgi:hypothetical protein